MVWLYSFDEIEHITHPAYHGQYQRLGMSSMMLCKKNVVSSSSNSKKMAQNLSSELGTYVVDGAM